MEDASFLISNQTKFLIIDAVIKAECDIEFWP